MSKFLSLTRWNYATGETNEVLVNMDNVTHMYSRDLPLREYKVQDPVTREYITKFPAQTWKLTHIMFTVGLGEDCDAIYVTESLQTILRNL